MSKDTPVDIPLRFEIEMFWVNMQPLLWRRGYKLRPRYDPDWKPSWLQPRPDGTYISKHSAEDSIPGGAKIMDAVRIYDGSKVVFKIVDTKTEEIPIACWLSSEDNFRDPRNCSVPVVDVVLIPGDDDRALMAMPQVLVMDSLPFRHLGELCEAAIQVFDGLEFLHENNIVHRDIYIANIAMDASKTVPKGFHLFRWPTHDGVSFKFEWKTRWSVRPTRYYIIDYGLSRRCVSKSETVIRTGGQYQAPEMATLAPFDPFKADVYQLGRVLKELVGDYIGFDPFSDLADKLTAKDPAARPTMAEANQMCKDLVVRLRRTGQLGKRVWRTYDGEKAHIRDLVRLIFYLSCWNPLD